MAVTELSHFYRFVKTIPLLQSRRQQFGFILGNCRILTRSFNSHCVILCCCVNSSLLKKSELLEVLCLCAEISLESLLLSSLSVLDSGGFRTGSPTP